MPKVVVQFASEDECSRCWPRPKRRSCGHVVRDAGRTVVQAGTATCVGIGPAPAERIDEITGALPLVR